MWHYWRVYNTLQDPDGKTDDLAPVVELPDRAGTIERAVTSDALIGETVTFGGRAIDVSAANLGELVETQLPPQGQRRDAQDAQVFDWLRDGDRYLNEPETRFIWANYRPRNSGQRPPFVFAPATGQLAWPFLQPNLGLRPPFAPNHNPAPFLEPLGADGRGPAPPGANGALSVCPPDAPLRRFKIHAIQLRIRTAPRETLNTGMLFVLQDEESAVRNSEALRVPLAIRGQSRRLRRCRAGQ